MNLKRTIHWQKGGTYKEHVLQETDPVESDQGHSKKLFREREEEEKKPSIDMDKKGVFVLKKKHQHELIAKRKILTWEEKLYVSVFSGYVFCF